MFGDGSTELQAPIYLLVAGVNSFDETPEVFDDDDASHRVRYNKRLPKKSFIVLKLGGPSGIRTHDTRLKRPLL